MVGCTAAVNKIWLSQAREDGYAGRGDDCEWDGDNDLDGNMRMGKEQ